MICHISVFHTFSHSVEIGTPEYSINNLKGSSKCFEANFEETINISAKSGFSIDCTCESLTEKVNENRLAIRIAANSDAHLSEIRYAYCDFSSIWVIHGLW